MGENTQDKIWAPWRIEYILGKKPPGCVFCEKPAKNDDRANLILYRGKKNFVIMNLYPYNNGHVMIVPYDHLDSVALLDDETTAEMMVLTKKCVRLFKAVLRPDGFNIGLNMGQTAGAGIHEHVHLHIVPRWLGDSNYMPVLADTKVISQHIDESYEMLMEGMEQMREEFPIQP